MNPSILQPAEVNSVFALVASLYAGKRTSRARPIDPVGAGSGATWGSSAWGIVAATAGAQVHDHAIAVQRLPVAQRVRRLSLRVKKGTAADWSATLLSVDMVAGTSTTLHTLTTSGVAGAWLTLDTGAVTTSLVGTQPALLLRLTSAAAGDTFARGRIWLDVP